MVTARSDITARYECVAVVLADPELLDLAFAEVIASWEAEPPRPPDRTLVVTSERRNPRSRERWADRDRQVWRTWLRAIPRPRVARSPPERSVAGRF
jgi:hypothetical protein